jgi:solute carrier family 44 (choline transporter-like protein), member 2/4/5
MQCAICCVSCFEKIIRFINSYAYILIALEGKSFCSAARDAFYLSYRNLALFGIVKSLANIFVLFSSLMISSLTALVGYLLITNIDQYSTSIYSPVIPTIAFWFIGLIISLIFMTVYGIAADTLCVCLSIDKEINNGVQKSCP